MRPSAKSLAFGPDAKDETGGLKVGDVVLVYPWLGCGKCETCLGGDENMCVRQAELARRLLRRRLCRSHDGAAPEIPAQPEGPRSRHRGALCLLGRHHLQRAEEGRKCHAHADRDLRRRRPRPDGAVAVEGDGRQGRHRRRYRCAQARGRDGGRRARDRRRQGAGRAGAACESGRRPDPRGDRSGRQARRPRSSASTA